MTTRYSDYIKHVGKLNGKRHVYHFVKENKYWVAPAYTSLEIRERDTQCGLVEDLYLRVAYRGEKRFTHKRKVISLIAGTSKNITRGEELRLTIFYFLRKHYESEGCYTEKYPLSQNVYSVRKTEVYSTVTGECGNTYRIYHHSGKPNVCWTYLGVATENQSDKYEKLIAEAKALGEAKLKAYRDRITLPVNEALTLLDENPLVH